MTDKVQDYNRVLAAHAAKIDIEAELSRQLATFATKHGSVKVGAVMSSSSGDDFRVAEISARILYGSLCIEYSGPRIKKDGGDHATARGMAFEFVKLGS